MNVLLLMPDGMQNPSGGLGVHVRNVVKHFNNMYPDVFFYIVGREYDTPHMGQNYVYTPIDSMETNFLKIEVMFWHIHMQHLYMKAVYEAVKLKNINIDLVIVNDWPTFNIAKIAFSDTPIMSMFQLSMFAASYEGMQSAIKKMFASAYADMKIMNYVYEIEDRMVKESNSVVFVSNAIRRKFLNDDQDFEIIYNGIDPEEFIDNEPIRLPGKNNFKVVFIGRLNGQKGIFELIKTKIPEDIDLIIVGGEKGQTVLNNGMTGTELIKKYASTQDNIYYYGPAWGKEKSRILHSANAVLFPSTHEPFGIVALEALITNNILITTAVDGMQEFLTPDSYVYISHTPESIAEGLSQAKLIYENEFMYNSILKEGRKICSMFTWQKVVKQYMDVIHKTINKLPVSRESKVKMLM